MVDIMHYVCGHRSYNSISCSIHLCEINNQPYPHHQHHADPYLITKKLKT